MKTRDLLSLFILLVFIGDVCAYTVAVGGELRINEEPAPEGTEIVAKVDDIEVAAYVVEKEGAYLITVDCAEDYMYKYVNFYINGIKADEKVMLKTNRFESLDIDIQRKEATPTTSTTPTVKTPGIRPPDIGVIGRITEFSANNFATLLGLLLVLLMIISTLRDRNRDKDEG